MELEAENWRLCSATLVRGAIWCQGVGRTPAERRLGTGALPVAFACCVRRLLLAKGLGTGALAVAFACCARYFSVSDM